MHDGRRLSLTWALLVLADRVRCWKHDWVVSWRDLSFPTDKWWLYRLWTVTYPEEDLKAKQLTWASCVTHWFAGREKQSKYFLTFQVWMEGYCLPPAIELLITECCGGDGCLDRFKSPHVGMDMCSNEPTERWFGSNTEQNTRIKLPSAVFP